MTNSCCCIIFSRPAQPAQPKLEPKPQSASNQPVAVPYLHRCVSVPYLRRTVNAR